MLINKIDVDGLKNWLRIAQIKRDVKVTIYYSLKDLKVNSMATAEASNGKIAVTIGGCLSIMLIDSGSPINTVPSEWWDKMKRQGAFTDLTHGSNRIIKAYATEKPLEVEVTFRANIEVVGHVKPSTTAKFYVIKDANQSLLSRETAVIIKLLKIGVDVSALKVTETNEHTTETAGEFPSIPGVMVKLSFDPTIKPVRIVRIRIPVAMQDAVQQRLDEREKLKIIEDAPLDAPWMSPMEVVPKGKGDFRIVYDLREPNKAVNIEHHPMPHIPDFHRQLHGAKKYSKIDITGAFHHLKLHPESRGFTAFMTPKGPKQFTRVPFGLNTAPETYQRHMEVVLNECNGKIVYVDDVLITGEDSMELGRRTDLVKAALKKNNLTINEAKCVYDVDEIEFLGYKISSGGFRPADDKVHAIRMAKTPENVAELRSFLGLVNHLGQYIPHLATVTERLRLLTKKDTRWTWEKEHNDSFEEVRRLIIQDIKQHGFYHPNLQTRLYVDASPVGLGAVFTQIQKSGKEQVVQYAAKSLSAAEKNYPQYQREALAAVWAIEHFSHFLLGKQFTLYTDNKAVEYLLGGKQRDCKRAITRA